MKLIKHWAARFAFVFLSALIVVTNSERVYWYLGGIGIEQNLGIALWYMIPMLAGLWAIGSGASSRIHQLVLAGAVFGFVVEGVLVGVLYEDGPLPVMAALFVGWHGLVSLLTFWYFTRKWLLERKRMALAAGAAVVGSLWGVWSIVYRLPETMEDMEEPFTVMEPAEFAGYALVVGGVFVLAHWLIGYVWPDQFKPGKWGRRGIVALCLGYASLAVIPAIPWAPIKFGVLMGGTLWLLRRSREHTTGEPSAIEALRGRVALSDVAILMIAPVAAGLAYAGVWALDLSDDVVQGIFATFSITEVVAGLVAFVWAARRSIRSPRGSRGEFPPTPELRSAVLSPQRGV